MSNEIKVDEVDFGPVKSCDELKNYSMECLLNNKNPTCSKTPN